MIRKILFSVLLIFIVGCKTTPPVTINLPEVNVTPDKSGEKKNYRKTYTKHADLIHTRLTIRPDWKKKELSGQAAIILRPHFYPVDSLVLNARGMELGEVSILSNGKHVPLSYHYDSLLINIRLDRQYTRDESFTIFISYTAKPERLPAGGSEAITNDKGLYFIDADSLDPFTPTQVWTQGETESNSVWFPTIEDPGQKMTQEIYITVDTAFITVSNGLLISTINNGDGTKTDYWKQSLPAAPYLTMFAAGDYSVVHDSWKNIDVSYYVDPPYEKYARMIFGHTPEMLTFFSEKLGVPFYWEKFAQVVVHDYVSGAMENTTAVVHGTNMQQDPREYRDGNYEDYIAHEIFHHWFGDLVTCESWSNLTLNEGFADYAEYLWREYKFGTDNADHHYQSELASYLYRSAGNDPPLIRYEYADREDMYDAISYNKGGRILHMLRKHVGDEAFFAALQLYLLSHQFSTAEAADLRMAFEKITGEDLNWFFDQWFLKGGHPKINIDYEWSDSLKRETITVSQKQNLDKNPLYRLPLETDIYCNGKVERKKIVVEDVTQSFQFDLPVKPDLVNVDADKMLLCTKTDNKTNEELIFQYDHAPLYLDRYEAISKIGKSYKVYTPEAEIIKKALRDKSEDIRVLALNNIREVALNDSGNIKQLILEMATKDSSVDVREKAMTCLGLYFSYSEFSKLFSDALNDSSYLIVARAFKVISDKDPEKAKVAAVKLEADSGNAIVGRLAEYYSNSTADKNAFYRRAMRLSDSYQRYYVIRHYTTYLKSSSSPPIISEGIENIYEYSKRPSSDGYHSALINAMKDVDSSVGKKISDLEAGIETTGDNIQKTEMLSQLPELKSLRNKIQDRIKAIEFNRY